MNSYKISTALAEILNIKKELGEISKNDVALLWEENDRLMRLYSIIKETKHLTNQSYKNQIK